MRSESRKIEKNDTVDNVLTAIYDNYDVMRFSSHKLNQMIKKRVTKQKLADYLKEIQFSGFGNGGFRNLEDLSAQYFYDYARNFEEYDDIFMESMEYFVRQFPKKELVYAINILGGKVSPTADMYEVRKIAINELMKSDDDYYKTFSDGFEDDAVYAIYSLFEKWFFPQLNGCRVSVPRKKQPRKIQVNVRRMF